MKKLAIITAALLCGCSGEVTAPNPPNPPPQNVTSITVDIVAGQAQSDTVGQTLATPLTVQVTDQEERAVRGQVVNFVVVSGGGSVFAGAAATNAEGRAADIWTLGTTAGEQRVEIRAVTPDGVPQVFGVFTAEAVPDVAVTLQIGAENRGVLVGDRLPLGTIAVTAADQYGNAIDRAPELTVAGPAALSGDTVVFTDNGYGEVQITLDDASAVLKFAAYPDLASVAWDTVKFNALDKIEGKTAPDSMKVVVTIDRISLDLNYESAEMEMFWVGTVTEYKSDHADPGPVPAPNWQELDWPYDGRVLAQFDVDAAALTWLDRGEGTAAARTSDAPLTYEGGQWWVRLYRFYERLDPIILKEK